MAARKTNEEQKDQQEQKDVTAQGADASKQPEVGDSTQETRQKQAMAAEESKEQTPDGGSEPAAGDGVKVVANPKLGAVSVSIPVGEDEVRGFNRDTPSTITTEEYAQYSKVKIGSLQAIVKDTRK